MSLIECSEEAGDWRWVEKVWARFHLKICTWRNCAKMVLKIPLVWKKKWGDKKFAQNSQQDCCKRRSFVEMVMRPSMTQKQNVKIVIGKGQKCKCQNQRTVLCWSAFFVSISNIFS